LRSLLKTLRLEPFFLFVSLVESHTLARTTKICICGTKMGTGSINPQDRRFWRTYPPPRGNKKGRGNSIHNTTEIALLALKGEASRSFCQIAPTRS
jgi:hypothetical protein